MNKDMNKPLEGVKIIDLTRVLAGPYCTMILADLGAEIIKIEMPEVGDDSREFTPFKNGESVYFSSLNRGKKGMTLNLKSPEGKEIFRKLVSNADMVLENYRPGVMEKLGFSYEKLKEINPKLIYGSVSGYGQTGPSSQKPGYDIIGQAVGGLMSTTGWPTTGPTRVGTAMGDLLGGLNLTIGVLAALNRQRITGKGEKVDVALVDSVVSSMQTIINLYLVEGRVPQRIGNRYEPVYPYDSFKAKDGDVIIGAGNDKLYSKLVAEMDREDLRDNPKYIDIKNRIENHEELKAIIEEWTSNKSVDEIVSQLDSAGIPTSPINTVDMVVKDEQINSRNMFVKQHHPKAGEIILTNNAIKLTETNSDPGEAAPTLGRDNEYILKEILGYTNEEYQILLDKMII